MVRHPTPQTLLDARKLCALPAPSSTLTSEEEEAGKASRDAITHHPYRLTFKKKEGEEARPGGFSMRNKVPLPVKQKALRHEATDLLLRIRISRIWKQEVNLSFQRG